MLRSEWSESKPAPHFIGAGKSFEPQFPPAGGFEDLKFEQQRRDWTCMDKHYLISVYKLKCLIYNVRVQSLSRILSGACAVLKIKEFTQVNDCFQNKHNSLPRAFGAEIGHYRRIAPS